MAPQATTEQPLTLLLVRHGQTAFNAERRYSGQSDVPLSELGLAQVEALAQNMPERSIDHLYTSDLTRAIQTAASLAKSTGLTPARDPALRELGLGVVEGLTFEEADDQFPGMIPAWYSDPNQPPQGGETYDAFSQRVASFISRVKREHSGETLLVTAHGGTIGEILRLSFGLPPKGNWYFKITNASLTELTLFEEAPLLISLNETHHIAHVQGQG